MACRIVPLILFVSMIISCAAVPAPSMALENPTVVIFGEDADQDTIPRNNRVFRRVFDALSEALNNEGFDVFDETAITLDTMSQGRVRRTDAEIIDVARTVTKPPIDIAVIFAIYAHTDVLEYTTKIKTRIAGRLLQVQTGQRLGNFEVTSPQSWNASTECDRDCILETVGRYSKILGQDVGAVLAEKLLALTGIDAPESTSLPHVIDRYCELTNKFVLIFDGFSRHDMLDVEEYLVVFRGYQRHRPTYSGERHTELWYETCSGSARLDRNLVKMLDRLDMRGRVAFSGNEFTVQKINLRRRRPANADDFE